MSIHLVSVQKESKHIIDAHCYGMDSIPQLLIQGMFVWKIGELDSIAVSAVYYTHTNDPMDKFHSEYINLLCMFVGTDGV